MNTQVCIQIYVWTYIFISLRYMSRSGITRSYDKSTYNSKNIIKNAKKKCTLTDYSIPTKSESLKWGLGNSILMHFPATFPVILKFENSHSGKRSRLRMTLWALKNNQR